MTLHLNKKIIFLYIIANCFFTRLKLNFVEVHIDDIFRSYTSIAFYIIATIKQKFDTDLRGNFWEPLLKKTIFNYSLQYVSDGNFTVNGVDFRVYGNYTLEPNQILEDRQECKRVSASWEDFIEHNLDKKWFFKGGHDTYVNIPELLKLISKLEQKGDPMTTYNFAYIIHIYKDTPYPQGGAGFLASNYAIRQFVANIDKFHYFCNKSFDDVALGYFIPSFNLSLLEYETRKFVAAWPSQTYLMVKNNQTKELKKCPNDNFFVTLKNFTFKNSFSSAAASIHYHDLPMKYAAEVISSTPKDVGIYWKNGIRAQFCSFDLEKQKYLHYNIKN